MRDIANTILSVALALFLASGLAAGAQKEKAPGLLKPHDFTAHLVGHAHIDLSWLWRWEEAVHDIATHTFLGTLAQMDKFPGLTFAQSQAAVYEAIEKNYPTIFQRIKEKVKGGTWDKFGVEVTVGWNPDGFGHNFQLPQILSKAGIKSYVFERCAPEKMPVFWWEGLDGSRLLAYVPPGWYLADLKNGVKDLIFEASKNTLLKDFMLLYGEGDHGGGPRATDLEAIQKFKNDKNHPRLEFVTPQEYFRVLERSGIEFPVVKRELNYTFPACYTTQAQTKKYNRRLEILLLTAERFSAVAVTSGARSYYPERDIDEAWKSVHRNQFDVKGNVLRMSIVHGATDPDPEADRGEHELLYSLYPHTGDWQEARSFRKGYELNSPLIAHAGMVHAGGWPADQSFLRVEPENVILSSLKKESGYFSRASILRLYELFGKETEVRVELPGPVEAIETDIIERPLAKIDTDGKILRFKIRPFEIKTFRILPIPRRQG